MHNENTILTSSILYPSQSSTQSLIYRSRHCGLGPYMAQDRGYRQELVAAEDASTSVYDAPTRW